MTNILQTIGRFAYQNPWKVLGAWLVIMVLLGFGAQHFYKAPTNAITIPGTEAQVAIDRASQLFPSSGKGSGRIVFAAPAGSTVQQHTPEITQLLTKVAHVDGVARVISPFEAPDFIAPSQKVAYAQVQLVDANGSIAETTLDEIAQLVAAARSDTLQIEAGGDLVSNMPGEILGVGEAAGVAIALLVLVMTLGSLVAAGMPVFTALLGIGISVAGLFSLSQVVNISTTTPVLAVMLGLAVGIDYALFLLNKYRNYLLAGFSIETAIAKTLGTAGNAVVFAAITVIIALAALSIVNIPFMTTMGLAGAASIAVAALTALTATPALLRLAGLRIFRNKTRQKVLRAQAKAPRALHEFSKKSLGYRWGGVLVRRPVIALTVGLVVAGVVALPVKDLRLGLPTDEFAAVASSERKAYELVKDNFGVGHNGPLVAVVEHLPAVSTADKEAVRTTAMAEFHKQVAAATAKQKAYFAQKAAAATTLEDQLALQQEMAQAAAKGEAEKKAGLQKVEQAVAQYAPYVQLQKVADNIARQPGVAAAQAAIAADDGTHGIVQIVPSSAPSDAATTTLINTLRSADTQHKLAPNATLSITGTTALQNDINQKLAAALPQYLAVVVGLSLVLLLLAFRSVLVPLKATLGFLLSVLAMLGAVVAVFQWGWFGIAEAPGPIVSFIPIIATGILFGLAMDYEFFLVSGMREAYMHGKKPDAKRAVQQGFASGSKVVIAAALIMVSVFAGFITNHDATIQAIGFGLAVGVFIDAFIVRMTIVPALMSLLGRSAWWLPKPVDKHLPRVSIEGES